MRCLAHVSDVRVICPLWGALCRVIRVAKRYGVMWSVVLFRSALYCAVGCEEVVVHGVLCSVVRMHYLPR